ncbi:primary-amine oxidase [Amycolatopsis alkalitolerans]|uniref:primary-amine oxidase n=1 Tax=Amycolatopsis alkalitolerans TaxID=2547244 RepID=UPI001F2F3858|nr:primary-amine oxidase [Amycolatopsis alkalitolerans]
MTSTAKPALVTATHPLDPLSPGEIAAASAILREARGLAPTARFVYIEAAEPEKSVVTGFSRGQDWDRCAAVMLRERAERRTYEAVVSLSRGEVVSWKEIPGVQPPITLEEFLACEALVQADPRWQEAMSKRGITDFSLTMVDPWASGYRGPEDDPAQRRLARPLTFVRSKPDDNGYARPVENVIVTVDLDTMDVLDVEDHGVVRLPPRPGNYDPAIAFETGNVPAFGQAREAAKPISITQPEGRTFTVDGHAVSWGPWRLRVGFTPREGLVLHDIGYLDRGTLRPVIHRASLSEMYVPYGDPGSTHWNKNVFDMGEYGLGVLANSLQLGCDCLGEIHYFDAWVNDQDGEALRLPNAICMHEEDFSIGWKHTDFRTEKGEVRRNRRLVVSFFATVGNYDYGFYWNLYLDGSIEFEVKLTGIISTGAVPPGEAPEYGTLVAPGLYGPNHQHFFNVRLDMRVDGDRNNLYELESSAAPMGEDNPYGNAWRQVKRQLTSESEAKRVINPLAGRSWLITSADRRNALGGEVGYKLEPGSNVLPFYQEGSQQFARGQFAMNHLWATPYTPGERFACGDYVAQNPGGAGLPAYTRGNRSLEDGDLVVWYTLGAHHVVRPEDWPVMPVTRVNLHLKPAGFFDGNPMLDLPPEPGSPHCHA